MNQTSVGTSSNSATSATGVTAVIDEKGEVIETVLSLPTSGPAANLFTNLVKIGFQKVNSGQDPFKRIQLHLSLYRPHDEATLKMVVADILRFQSQADPRIQAQMDAKAL